MKKKIIMALLVMATVVGMGFADAKPCIVYDNYSLGGISVSVSSKKDPNDKDITIQDYINIIKIMSNGNKMRIQDCEIKLPRQTKGEIVYKVIGVKIEEYGDFTFEWKSHGAALSREDIKVTAQGCN